jgi:hypothetical protein
VASVDDFACAWTTEREQWVVLRADADKERVAFNRVLRSVLLIDEDDVFAAAVVRRMVALGLPVTTSPEIVGAPARAFRNVPRGRGLRFAVSALGI